MESKGKKSIRAAALFDFFLSSEKPRREMQIPAGLFVQLKIKNVAMFGYLHDIKKWAV
jgi:hypothetical protein